MAHLPSQAHINTHSKTLTFWSGAFVDAVLARCIPVLFADHMALPFSDLIDWSNFVLRYHESHLLNVTHQVSDVVVWRGASVVTARCWQLDDVEASQQSEMKHIARALEIAGELLVYPKPDKYHTDPSALSGLFHALTGW